MTTPLAIFGDWHGHTGWAIGSVDAAVKAGAGTMLHVGDFGLDFPGRDRGRFEKKLNKVLVECGLMLVVSPGNHDNWTTMAKLEVEEDGLATWRSNIRVLPRGGRTVIGGLTVGGLGGAYSVDQQHRTLGIDWWALEEPTQEEADRLVAGGPVDLLITHDVPASVPMTGDLDLPANIIADAERTRILLDEVVRKLQPSHLFAGHWHSRFTHELRHPGGNVTRVDVLANEINTMGNGVLVWPSESRPLRIETLRITTR
ncbi:metallophosphoesterase [Arthrobacter sp. H5]|uniref:metallophosphoesterase n=1 Tax=Arthrobacter sp. H5 TaxID=1267973 RepID=UPI0004885E90|nr:metallophosphoesterase [Arthrobacter sp. H5]